jgi:hypothetical protein
LYLYRKDKLNSDIPDEVLQKSKRVDGTDYNIDTTDAYYYSDAHLISGGGGCGWDVHDEGGGGG